MTYPKKYFHQIYSETNLSEKFDIFFIACLAIAPLCFLSVRGWTNFFAILVFAISAWKIAFNRKYLFILRKNTSAQLIILALASSFLAVLIAQLIRGKLQPELLDGPSRPLLAIFLFIYLLNKPIDFIRWLEWIAPLSLFILFIFLWFNPYGYSAKTFGRFGTSAVDPLTLGQYVTLLGFICLFIFNTYKDDFPVLKILKIIGILISIYISIGTASRSGWVAIPFLLIVWIFKVKKIYQPKKIFLILLLMSLIGFSIYKTIPTVHDRISQVAIDYKEYVHGGTTDTSTGFRLSLLRVAGILFLERPLSGYGDMHYPALASIPQIATFNTGELEYILIHSGTHNEIMQSALRSGIFGLVSSILMFFVPAIIFSRGSASTVRSVRTAGLVGLCYTVAVFCFGLTTETFNLKYTVSFYALMVSVLAAQVLRPQPA
nr:O-antigen ligase family protein [uncultured Albidiferax sp.]